MKKTENESSDSFGLTSRGKVLTVVLLTIFLNLFLFHKIGSMATVLVLGAYSAFGAIAFLGRNTLKEHKLLHLGLIAINLLFGLSILITDNLFSRTIVIFSWLISSSYAIYLFLEGKPFFTDLEEMIVAPLNMGLSYVISGFSILGTVLCGRISDLIDLGKRSKVPLNAFFRILVGLAISLPVVAILLGLLSSGDAVFAHMVGQIFQELGKVFSIKFWFEPIARVVFSVLILGAFLPLALIKLRKIPLKYIPNKLHFGTEVAVMLGLVAIVLGSFLIVDFPYVFASVAETALSKFGVATFSEYVKRGFFEFILVSVIVYGVLWAGLGVLRAEVQGQKSKIKSVLMGFQAILFIEFGIFLLSIFRRIFLYQQFHGWSLARIYGGLFLIWVLGMVVVLILRHFYQKSLLLAEVLITLMIIAFVGLFNSEGFIVSSHPPTVNKRVDYVYLSRMSTDGYAGWKQAYEHANNVLFKTDWEKNVTVGCLFAIGSTEIQGKENKKCVEWKTQKMVDSEGRREIAYAGMIVGNLLEHSYDLTADFGTKSERANFVRLAVGSSDPDLRGVQVLNNEWWMTGYSANRYLGFFNSIPKEQRSDRQFGFVDQLYVWNRSRWQAYQQMKTEIPISKLIGLQNKFFEKYKKIAAQPDGQKEFDMDISLGSPFFD